MRGAGDNFALGAVLSAFGSGVWTVMFIFTGATVDFVGALALASFSLLCYRQKGGQE